jgi:6-pyruvoyltetrahydropterin/6-carboxytetrahydropterin synthase
MGEINLKDIVFSKQVRDEWSDPKMWDKLLKNQVFINPTPQ